MAAKSVTDENEVREGEPRSGEDLERFMLLALHDLRGPLNSSLALAQLLLRRHGEDLHAEAKMFAVEIVSQLERMGSLVTDLAAFTHAGRADVVFEAVSLADVIRRALETLDTVMKETGAEIVIGNLPSVLGSPAQLQEVFRTLVGNAIQYKSPLPPRITISTAEQTVNRCTVCVRDNGIGFLPEYAGYIFEVFKRLDGSAIPGSGLGLAASNRIIERHNGRIWAESQPGDGAAFYVTLPLASV